MAVSMRRNPSIEKVRPICGVAFCRTKWHRRSEMSFYVARNGIDDRKCRFMSHEMASTIGNAVLCRTKWHRRSEMSFYVARNGIDDRKCRFMPHEMASTVGNAVLCRTKWHRRSVTRFMSHEKRLRQSFTPLPSTKNALPPKAPHLDPRKHPQQPSNAALSPPNAFQSKNRALPLFTNKKR